jgi:beta-lactamase class A
MRLASHHARVFCGALFVFVITNAAPAQTGDSLRAKLEQRIEATPGAFAGVYYKSLASGELVTIAPDSSFHAASTMKVPVMIEFFRQLERGGVSASQPVLLVNQFASIVDGSPFSVAAIDDSDSSMYLRVGERVAARELVDRMIVRSSNLATNAVIALIGAARADSTAHALGARNMRVLRGVEDGKAFQKGMNNTTTARDLGMLLEAIERHTAASKAACDTMLAILSRQEFNDEIPAGLPPGTRVAHKTGNITAVLHDAALVYPQGRSPYVLVVLTRNIPDERVARVLIADLSRLAYEHVMRQTAIGRRPSEGGQRPSPLASVLWPKAAVASGPTG